LALVANPNKSFHKRPLQVSLNEGPQTASDARLFQWSDVVQVALGTGLLYFAGTLYLSGFYGRLGLPDTEAEFDVPYVMTKSFFPLLTPVFFLAVLAVFTATRREGRIQFFDRVAPRDRLCNRGFLSCCQGVARYSQPPAF